MRRNHETPFPTGFLRRKPTLKEWCEYWLDTNAVKRPKAKKEDRSSLELHVYRASGTSGSTTSRCSTSGCWSRSGPKG